MRKNTYRQCGMISDYDARVYKGLSSKTDDLKSNSLVKSALLNALGVEVDMKLETGEKVTTTIATILVANTIKEAIQNPSTGKLKDIASITGELNSSIDVNVKSPQQLFGDIAISDDGK